MNKRILISLSVIGAVAALAIGGTIAYFSDVETSTGNTFTAGSLDLKVDDSCSYNGLVCKVFKADGYKWQLPGTPGPTMPDPFLVYPHYLQPCSCTWLEKDLVTGDLFFNYTDVKPGDEGENTVSLHVINNDAYICAHIANLANAENGCTEPESDPNSGNDQSCGTPPGSELGELQNAVLFTIWKDNGAGDHKCNNILDTDETAVVTDQPASNVFWPIADSQTGGPLAGNTTTCIGVRWSVPSNTGNIIQGDSMTGDVIFTAMQARNNAGFICPIQ